jgi:UDP-glucose 4-epimerase
MLSRVIVTGGSGFIGGQIARHLKESGAYVVNIDQNPPKVEFDEYIRGNIEDESTWRQVPEVAFDAILHLAARTSVLKSITDPVDAFYSNVTGTFQVLEYARKRNVPAVVSASSNAVVGNYTEGEITEALGLNPLTPYGATKAATEMLASGYHHSYDIATANIRLTNVYGPSMWNKDSIVPRLMRYAVGESDFRIYGDGDQFRDYVYIDDVVGAFIKLAEQRVTGTVSFGFGVSYTVTEVVAMVSKVVGRELSPPHIPPQKGEMLGVKISLEKADRLGLKALVSLEEGLSRTWDDFLATRKVKR